MVVVCPHGSAANNSSLGVVRVDAQFLNSILPNGIEWFNAYLWLVPAFNIDVPAFCSVDPPDPPSLDPDDLVALMSGGRLGTAQLGIQKIIQLVQNWAWYEMCHCLVDSTPAPPTPPSEPAGAPILNPGGGTPVTCFTKSGTFDENSGAGTFAIDSWLYHTAYIPKTIRYRLRQNYVGTPHTTKTGHLYFTGNGASPIISDTPFTFPPDVDVTLTVPPSATEFRVVAAYSGSSTDTYTTQIDGYCGDLAVPVSPSDPGGCCAETQGLLYQIYNLLTIQQRFTAPFAYIRHTEHSGLAGGGTLDVQGLVGLQIQVTTLPDYLGRDDGTPMHLFDGGWVSIGTEDGYSDFRRVDGVASVWLPPSMPAATVVAYSVPPGVVLRITELQAEP
jgi:hypothetical protein